MIELSKHIEYLLLENDCVIVPELGGFIAHYQPAHYDEDEGVFLPPYRTVGFNPELTMNDGLLTQSYMHARHTDFPDAVRLITSKVEEMKDLLYREGLVELYGIGRLHYTIYNTYEFHPNEQGILSPSLYALETFSILPLSAVVEETPAPVKEEPILIPRKERKEIRLNPRWWSNAVAVVVAAVLFFALSVPVENTYVDQGNYASLGTDCLFDAIRSHSMATSLMYSLDEPQQMRANDLRPVAVKVEKVEKTEEVKPATAAVKPAVEAVKPAVVEVKKEVKKEAPVVAKKAEPAAKAAVAAKPAAAKPAPKAVKTSSKKYHIIVASLTTSADAKRVIKEYNQQGYQAATVMENKGRYRISLCNYADKSAAYQKLNDLKKADAFKGAWVLTAN